MNRNHANRSGLTAAVPTPSSFLTPNSKLHQYRRTTATTRPRTEQPSPSMGS